MSNLYRIPSTEKRKVAMIITVIANSLEEAIKKYNNDEVEELEDVGVLESWDRVDRPSEIVFASYIKETK